MFTYLLFALVLVKSIECRVIKEYPLTADGLEIDFEVKNRDTSLYKMKIDVDEQNKSVRLIRSMPRAPAPVAAEGASFKPGVTTTIIPTIENRFISGVGCPKRHVKRGTFCFPDPDYYDDE